MRPIFKTFIYLLVAAICLGLVYFTSDSDQKLIAGFEKVGEEFFPEFTDPKQVHSVQVVSMDEKLAMVRDFKIEKDRSGKWLLRTHEDYPVYENQRALNTANSLMGIKRTALKSRRKREFEDLGVIDPLDEKSSVLKGRGDRIILRDENEDIVADYIVGKKVEEENHDDSRYYIRRPKESETYIANLSIDISTKFADWIEPDLLMLESKDIIGVTIDKYHMEEPEFIRLLQGASIKFTGEERTELTRSDSTSPWKLTGLDEEKFKLKTFEIDNMVRKLDNMKIDAVRPKPEGLNRNLSLDMQYAAQNNLSPRELYINLIGELHSKGFVPIEIEPEKTVLKAKEGQVLAKMSDGVVYVLNFGNIFRGIVSEIELGFEPKTVQEKNKKQEDSSTEDHATSTNKQQEESKSAEDTNDEDQPKKDEYRYLFVNAIFDETLLGDVPLKPTPPEKPNAKEPEEKDNSKPDSNSANQKTSEKKNEADMTSQKNDENKEKKGTTEEPQLDPQAKYELAMKAYEEDLRNYNFKLRQFEEKKQKGLKRVEELNDRFEKWYYIISADQFKSISLSKTDLYEEKTEKKPADTRIPSFPQPPKLNNSQEKTPSNTQEESKSTSPLKAGRPE